MTIASRTFSGEQDKPLMIALARQTQAENLHGTDLPYRLSSWALDNPENINLWFDDQQFLAWAAMQTPFWEIDYVCQPQAEGALHREILAWADQRAWAVRSTPYGHESWYVNVFSGQANRIRDLEETGFQCQADVGEDSLSKVLMRRSDSKPVMVYRPPKGFAVRPLAGEGEVDQYVELHRSVFGTKNMTVEWRLQTLHHPDYRPDLDIVVAAPDGRLGAFCICWFDEHTREGRIEPLGCYKDFRCYALGRVALSEGLQRLQSLGVKNMVVETDNFRNTAFELYESFNFQVIQDVLVYRKDYAG